MLILLIEIFHYKLFIWAQCKMNMKYALLNMNYALFTMKWSSIVLILDIWLSYWTKVRLYLFLLSCTNSNTYCIVNLIINWLCIRCTLCIMYNVFVYIAICITHKNSQVTIFIIQLHYVILAHCKMHNWFCILENNTLCIIGNANYTMRHQLCIMHYAFCIMQYEIWIINMERYIWFMHNMCIMYLRIV